jgi:hypothetical protein
LPTLALHWENNYAGVPDNEWPVVLAIEKIAWSTLVFLKPQISGQYNTAKAQKMADPSNRGTEEILPPLRRNAWIAPGTPRHRSPPRFGLDTGIRLSFYNESVGEITTTAGFA